MATSHLGNLTDGTLVITDGTNSYTITPTNGEHSFDEQRPTELYHDQGQIPSDGSGVREADHVRATATFSFMRPDDLLVDGTNLDSLMRWWAGGTSAAIDAVWSSTLTRTDGMRFLDVLWYEQGTGSGKPLATYPNCTVESLPLSIARPNVRSITVSSATARFPTISTVP